NRSYTTFPTTHSPQQPTTLSSIEKARIQPKARKTSKRFSPLRLNLLIAGGFLAGMLILILIIKMVGLPVPNIPAPPTRPVSKMWAFRTNDYIDSSPAVANGVVYVGSDDNKIYAIDTQSGQQKWVFATGSYVNSSPAVVDGVVYVGSVDHNVYA